jgi:FkbM family methyltransferase
MRIRAHRRPLPMRWMNGVRLLVDRGDHGITGSIYTGLHEFADMCFVLHFLRQGDHLFDLGANVGAYTMLAAKGCGASVDAVEPIPGTYLKLRRNVACNPRTAAVVCHQVGLGDRKGMLRFAIGNDATNHVAQASDLDDIVVEVPITTVDCLAALRRPSVIKLDVEGYEVAVLRGARAALADPKLQAALIEVNGLTRRYGDEPDAIFDIMREAGLHPFRYDPWMRHLQPHQPHALRGNVLFIRDSAAIRDRLQCAPPIRVFDWSI